MRARMLRNGVSTSRSEVLGNRCGEWMLLVLIFSLPLLAGCDKSHRASVSEMNVGTASPALTFTMVTCNGLTLIPRVIQAQGDFVVRINTSRVNLPSDLPLYNLDFSTHLFFRDGAKLECRNDEAYGAVTEAGSYAMCGNVVFRCSREGRYNINDVVQLQIQYKDNSFTFTEEHVSP